MKCFAVFATLATLAVAEPLLPLVARQAALSYGAGYAKTVTPLANPAVSAVVNSVGIGLRPNLPYAAAPAAAPYAAAAVAAVPAPYATAPVAAAPVAAAIPAPAVVAKAAVPAIPQIPGIVASQYHLQDEYKNYEYGYSNINSAKRERGNALTGVEGSYSYVDSYGLPQQVNYVADALGFRASGTNFPSTAATLGLNSYAPVAPIAAPLAARLHKRSIGAIAPVGYAGLIPQAAVAPAAYAGAIAAPVAAPYGLPVAPAAYAVPSAPAARQAILTRIQNNPGHAVSYRVD